MEAITRISPHTLARELNNSSMTVPTEPVAPTTASVGSGTRAYRPVPA